MTDPMTKPGVIRVRPLRIFALATILASGCDPAAPPPSEPATRAEPAAPLNPVIQEIVAGLSEERMAASLRKLESFGTRHVVSGGLGPERGIDAARDWLAQELASYDPRLEVSVQPFRLPAGTGEGRVTRDVEVANVIAVLPGTTEPGQQILVTAHYDTVNLHRKPVPDDDGRVREMV